MGCNASSSAVTPQPMHAAEAHDLWAMKPTNFADKRRKSNGTAPCFTRDNSGLFAMAGDGKKVTPGASVDNVHLAVPSTPVLKPGSVLVMGSSSSSKRVCGTETVTPCSSAKTNWSTSSSKELLMSDFAKRRAMRRPADIIVVEDSWYPAPRPNLRIQVRR